MNITVYSTPTCSYCHQVKQFLSQRGLQFIEHDVSIDRAAAEEMVRKSGQRGVPVVLVDGEVVVGFDRPRLEHLLANGGGGQRPHLGIQIADASKVAPRFGLAPASGAFVGRVSRSSPGEKAGLRNGDIITEVNSRSVGNASDLECALSRLAAGDGVDIVFLRGQEKLRSEIVF